MQEPPAFEPAKGDAVNPLSDEETRVLEIPAWKHIPGAVPVEKWLSHIEDWLNIIGVMLIAAVMLLTVGGVVSRYFFNRPIRGEIDITEISMAGIVFLGLAFTLRTHGHVRVEVFVDMLRGRGYHLTEFSTLLFALFLFAVTFYSSLQVTLKAWEVGDVTPELLLVTWPAKMSITLGALVICLRLVILLTQHLSQAIAGRMRKDL